MNQHLLNYSSMMKTIHAFCLTFTAYIFWPWLCCTFVIESGLIQRTKFVFALHPNQQTLHIWLVILRMLNQSLLLVWLLPVAVESWRPACCWLWRGSMIIDLCFEEVKWLDKSFGYYKILYFTPRSKHELTDLRTTDLQTGF